MRTLRTIGMALVAVVLSFSLAACSDDDDDDEAVNNNSDKSELLLGNWAITDYIGSYYDEDEKKWVEYEEHNDMNNPQEGHLRMEICPGIEKNELIFIEYEYNFEGRWEKYSPSTTILKGNYLINKEYPEEQGKIVKLTANQFDVFVSGDEKCTYTFKRIK